MSVFAVGLSLMVGPGFAAPYAIGNCLRVSIHITSKFEGEVLELVPCIIARSGGINFDPGTTAQSGANTHTGTWVGDLRPNETGAIYLSAGDLGGNFRGAVRPVKPIVDGAAYFGSLFAEPLFQYQQAAVSRNQSVDENLSIVRGSAVKTNDELKAAIVDRLNGAQQIAVQQGDLIASNSEVSRRQADGSRAAAIGIKQKLAQLPNQVSAIDLTSLDRRRNLPPGIVRNISEAVGSESLVGSVALGGSSTPNPTNGLANAIALESSEYDRIEISARGKEAFKEGLDALQLANFFSKSNIKIATALYADARSARAFLLNEVPVRQVADWSNQKNDFEMVRIDDAVNRVLTWAKIFGDKSIALKKDVADVAGGLKFKPDDSTLRVTEQIIEDAESRLDSNPVASLGGLFRARTLFENTTLYGGIVSKLNKWKEGNAARLRELFLPPETREYPGGVGKYVATGVSKQLKESFGAYNAAIEAGEYALLGSDKVRDVFGSELLGEIKVSLKDASEAARNEVRPLANLDEVAPLVSHWVSNEARIANAQNTKTEIAELTKLQNLYLARAGTLKIYAGRLEALSRLTALYSSSLSKLSWELVAIPGCLSSTCIPEIVSITDQLSEVSNLSKDANIEVASTLKRYDDEIKKLDQLIDAWLMVQPDPANPGAVVFRRQMREMTIQLR